MGFTGGREHTEKDKNNVSIRSPSDFGGLPWPRTISVRMKLAYCTRSVQDVWRYTSEFVVCQDNTDTCRFSAMISVAKDISLLKKALVELISRRGCAISCTYASLDIPADKLRESYVTRVPRFLITQSTSQMTNTNCCTPRHRMRALSLP